MGPFLDRGEYFLSRCPWPFPWSGRTIQLVLSLQAWVGVERRRLVVMCRRALYWFFNLMHDEPLATTGLTE
jgi:hypothetical protein